MAKIVGIRFKNTAKVYYFAPGNEEFKKNDGVIVETARGVEFGTVSIEVKEVDDKEIVQPLKPIIRKATQADLDRLKKNEEKAPDALRICNEKVLARGLDMKLINAEYTFDGSKIIFYFTAPGRIDFRDLVKDLASVFRIRIELRQIGIRDETRLLGGIAPCGRPCCCASCMSDFKKVSIKMAKTQGLSLNPTKISGLCGRLMCCLAYENDYYKEVYKKMPKIGSDVVAPDGKGVVISVNMLTYNVKVKIEAKDGSLLYKDYQLDQLKSIKANTEDEKLTKEELEAAKALKEDD
ncbi:MAG: stage 0 sporulation family protein [Clostridia bacterium]|nr:stage 0 sporulation family protein [Clostridia bacterium]